MCDPSLFIYEIDNHEINKMVTIHAVTIHEVLLE